MYINAGMVDMIAKPIAVKDLFKKIYKWLPKNLCIEEDEYFEDTEEAEKSAGNEEEDMYDCLDCKGAIKSMGSIELFKKIVSDYYKSGRDMRNTIIHEHDIEDWDNYAIHVHSFPYFFLFVNQ
jgi:uridine kinase